MPTLNRLVGLPGLIVSVPVLRQRIGVDSRIFQGSSTEVYAGLL